MCATWCHIDFHKGGEKTFSGEQEDHLISYGSRPMWLVMPSGTCKGGGQRGRNPPEMEARNTTPSNSADACRQWSANFYVRPQKKQKCKKKMTKWKKKGLQKKFKLKKLIEIKNAIKNWNKKGQKLTNNIISNEK